VAPGGGLTQRSYDQCVGKQPGLEGQHGVTDSLLDVVPGLPADIAASHGGQAVIEDGLGHLGMPLGMHQVFPVSGVEQVAQVALNDVPQLGPGDGVVLRGFVGLVGGVIAKAIQQGGKVLPMPGASGAISPL